jgi:hypothetical protein
MEFAMKRIIGVAAIVAVSVFLLVLAVVSLLGLLDPHKASIGFGMPTSDAAGNLFYRVFATRNLAIVATGATFLLARFWLPLAILVTFTTPLAISDMTLLLQSGINPPAFHVVALVLLILSAALLWARVALSRS